MVVGAGETLQFVLDSQSSTAANELYVSYGTMPTRTHYDLRFGQPFAADQKVIVPNTLAGTYYVLVYGANVPAGPANVTITASLVPFSVQAVTPGQVGTGPATLQISGARFGFGTVFQLRIGGTVLDATRIFLGDAATAFATFALTGQAQGTYDVWAVQQDGTSTELAAALQVVAAVPNSVQVQLIPPSTVLVGRPGIITVSYTNTGNTDVPAPLLLLEGQNVLFQTPGGTDYSSASLQLLGYNPTGPFGTLPPGFQGSITLSWKPVAEGAGVTSTFTLETLRDPNEPFDWNAVAVQDLPADTSPQQWAAYVSKAAPLLGSTWGAVVASLGNESVQLLKDASRAAATAGDSLYDFDALLQYAVGVYGSTPPAAVAPSFQVLGSQGEVTVYNAHVDGSGNALPLNSSWPTYVLVDGSYGYRSDLADLAAAIAAASDCFPNGHVNVLIATWQGATGGPIFFGDHVPWVAALHVDAAGADLGDVLTSLQVQGKIAFGTTTGIGEGLGSYVLNTAAARVSGLANIIALDPESALGGYLPPDLRINFQHSTAYEKSSLFDTHSAIAGSNFALDTGDLNDPVALHTYGVSWLTEQVLGGHCDLLEPNFTGGPDTLPSVSDPAIPSNPQGQFAASAVVEQIASHDPNNIIGPQGSGTNQYVPDDQPLPYEVTFTNQSTANGPAQKVTITDQLDPNIDWRTFRLGTFGFGGLTFTVPAGSAFYQARIDLTQTNGYYVDVTATIDVSTGIATWTFDTVSPGTGQRPLDPTVGFLEVDTDTDSSAGGGEGFVSYTVVAAAAATTGTVIHAQATITFDNNPPLPTDTISNTVATGSGLTSSVATLPTYSPLHFPVSWSGSADPNGPGIATYDIYVSDNGSAFTAWLKGTSATPATYPGQDGHTYAFYSVATDYAGNQQATPSSAQASTSVDLTGPAVNVAAPANGSSTNSTTPTLSGAAGTAAGDSSTITVKIYSGPSATGTPVQVLTTTASAGAWSVAAAALGQGTYTAQAQQGDAAGNTGFSTASTFVVDTTAPVVTLTTPANGSSTNSATPTFNGAAGTASGDASTITVKVYSGTSATGTPVQCSRPRPTRASGPSRRPLP